MPSEPRTPTRPRAFSLVEIMVVVVIIGLLAGAVAIKVRHYVDKARSNRARSDLAVIVTALEAYYAEHAAYPTNEDGLSALPISTRRDPWNQPYQYNQPGQSRAYDVMSYGADGREGGAGQDADIGNWDLEDAREEE